MKLLSTLILCVGFAISLVVGHLSDNDIASFRSVFESALSKPKDVVALYYGLAGLNLLGIKSPDPQSYCKFVQTHVDSADFESVFAATGAASYLDGCKITGLDVAKIAASEVKDDQTAQNLGFIAGAAKFSGLKLDNAKLLKAFAAALKTDDSVSNLAYSFHAVSNLAGDLKPFYDRIEDLVAQADEVNGEHLQFSEGLSITARAISGIYTLAEKVNNTPPMKPEELVKFTAYLLSRKRTQLVRPAFHLLRALNTLSNNKHQIPVSISLVSPVAVTPAANKVQVKVCNVLGHALGSLAVVIETATHKPTSGVVVSKMAMAAVPGDKTSTLYEVNFLDQKREKGFYALAIKASSAKDKRLVGTSAEVTVKVLTDILVEGVEVSVSDREQQSTSNVLRVQHPNKIPTLVEADHHQKLLMKFSLKEKSGGKLITAHQAFILFSHMETGQEIIFVAEADSTKVYKFDVDLLKSAKDFNFMSGKYNLMLVVGDAVVSNPILWKVAEVSLKFPASDQPAAVTEIDYKPKKEIKHEFRKPDKRPPMVISNAFSILVLVPLLVLFVLWIGIGVNISGIYPSLYTLGFHVGLGGIFWLYLQFWLSMDMFQTLKCLALFGGVTFLFGNAMLRGIAERRRNGNGKSVE